MHRIKVIVAARQIGAIKRNFAISIGSVHQNCPHKFPDQIMKMSIYVHYRNEIDILKISNKNQIEIYIVQKEHSINLYITLRCAIKKERKEIQK